MANLDEYGGRAPGSGVVTTSDVPGYRLDKVFGEVFGLTARLRNMGSRIGAGLKSLAGGELRGLAKALAGFRNQAMERQALARQANAVLMMRFDVSGAAWAGTEVRAYGCAAAISPLS